MSTRDYYRFRTCRMVLTRFLRGEHVPVGLARVCAAAVIGWDA